jgi:hypothetical protein
MSKLERWLLYAISAFMISMFLRNAVVAFL